MKIGFTGTRRGMDQRQMAKLVLMLQMLTVDEFHHGDCVGADQEAHCIARVLKKRIVVHPPEAMGNRAWCLGDVTMEKAPYLTRNRNIVEAVDLLIAAPLGDETTRSGTWFTVRYARKLGIPTLMLYRKPQSAKGD